MDSHRTSPPPRKQNPPEPPEEAQSEPAAVENPWRPIDEGPHDRIVEGRFSPEEEVGRPIRWRNSRRRVGHEWVDGGVWHAAETAGAVQLRPIEWREWAQAELHFPEKSEEAA
jgi:hypothetical protein